MKIRLVSVGTRLPGWINEGVETYVRRLPAGNSLSVEEIAVSRRRGSAAERMHDEGNRLLARIKARDHVIALDETGTSFSSRELAGELSRWRQSGSDVAMLIGGADGLSDACVARANSRWSLSRHTLPHGLVRVLVAEQVYRAWTLINGHPYHRD